MLSNSSSIRILDTERGKNIEELQIQIQIQTTVLLSMNHCRLYSHHRHMGKSQAHNIFYPLTSSLILILVLTKAKVIL